MFCVDVSCLINTLIATFTNYIFPAFVCTASAFLPFETILLHLSFLNDFTYRLRHFHRYSFSIRSLLDILYHFPTESTLIMLFHLYHPLSFFVSYIYVVLLLFCRKYFTYVFIFITKFHLVCLLPSDSGYSLVNIY